MEAAALNAAHVDVAFIHEGLDEERKCFAARPEGGIGADMRPECLHQLEAAADIGDELRQNGGTATREHSQRHIWARSHHIHEFFQCEIRRDRFVAIFGMFEQGKSVAEGRTFPDREEKVF